MFRNICISLSVAILLSACRTSNSAASVKSDGTWGSSIKTCERTLDSGSETKVKLILSEHPGSTFTLQVLPSSPAAEMVGYSLKGEATNSPLLRPGVPTDIAPEQLLGRPAEFCGSSDTDNAITVWKEYGSVGTRAGISYIKWLVSCTHAASTGSETILTTNGKTLQIEQPNLSRAWGAGKQVLSSIENPDPTRISGKPKFSCKNQSGSIDMWGNDLIRVNNKFYKVTTQN